MSRTKVGSSDEVLNSETGSTRGVGDDVIESMVGFDVDWEAPLMRSKAEIDEAENEMSERIWYDRHQLLRIGACFGEGAVDSAALERANRAAQRIEGTYGAGDLGPWDDFEWGMLNGKLSTLRWVLGDDWDMLDT